MDPYNSLKADIHKDPVGPRGAFALAFNAQCEDHSENEEKHLGAIKEYDKYYSIIWHFKPHSIYVCQIVIFQYFISVHMKPQLVS